MSVNAFVPTKEELAKVKVYRVGDSTYYGVASVLRLCGLLNPNSAVNSFLEMYGHDINTYAKQVMICGKGRKMYVALGLSMCLLLQKLMVDKLRPDLYQWFLEFNKANNSKTEWDIYYEWNEARDSFVINHLRDDVLAEVRASRKDWYFVSDLENYAKVDRLAIYSMLASGELPAVISGEDVDRIWPEKDVVNRWIALREGE